MVQCHQNIVRIVFFIHFETPKSLAGPGPVEIPGARPARGELLTTPVGIDSDAKDWQPGLALFLPRLDSADYLHGVAGN
jgi:hypothetical protein